MARSLPLTQKRPRPRSRKLSPRAKQPAANKPDLLNAFAQSTERIGAPWPAAIAVSGGSDSIALMHLLAAWARANGRALPVVLTVDHGLRKGSRATAHAVQSAAKVIGLKAFVLTWKGKKPASNVEALARDARYRLMGEWCVKNGFSALYLGHTENDLAETFLLRLARGSGVDGLAAMSPVAAWPLPRFSQLSLVRPLLDVTRDQLRGFLRMQGVSWQEDPMNDDLQFARTKIRRLLPVLAEAGLSQTRIADAATHLARARGALEQATASLLRSASRIEDGVAFVSARALAGAPREIGLRALAALLRDVSGAAYRPRFERLERLFDSLAAEFPKGQTLHGCKIRLAPRAKALFGPSTMIISPEGSRRRPAFGETGGAVLA